MTSTVPAKATGAAHLLSALALDVLGGPLPLRLRAWDGSESGPADAPVVVLRSRRALRRLLWQPGELGLAQAYITGELDVDGDLAHGLRTMWSAQRERGLRPPRLTAADRARALATVVRLGAVGPRPPAPDSQARLRGGLHSKARDRAAISHHYDLSNDFYRLLLDETMAYSCGYWASDDDGFGPADAQRAKLELIRRKLSLAPGSRLLDIGCGWGSFTLYAAERHGVQVTAVTLAREQAAYVREQVRERGLGERVDVVCQDYRDIQGGGYDAVATVEMGEHVGDAEYPAFAAALHRLVRPGGRVLVQQMSRGRSAPGGGAFIEAYIAPDMHMRPLGETVALLEEAGLEVRHSESLREHYVRSIEAWHRTLEEHWQRFLAQVGEETARVWRLYLVGAALAFEEGRMGVDQILSVRPGPGGASGMPTTTHAWYEGLEKP
ncbi:MULTISPECIES: SAM-dependent methyltransferase [Streptomyces]|uniref:Putative cyclopropane-fatty-acyl-phospholipid synthase n=1 Tax=Streptomyces scabiei (strain 87.22) TaxID=680198 RepID=C9Z3K7_STRSW|nr:MULTISPECIES: cyclopropane-fatty-acyl-phospholipid synthase family protein [Streptomyces]MBP5859843.1 class I SAM-dependent methyltransferase [Streptomyces sp. LBUM 1484]KFG06295.1 cyclopropane-fatty-acyl-phospholipid synthase [Streptomyces scabiei]MBP5879896.1 class I SAM-dependent methyltransferase [Streptomyces sp. LBUM 1477]MBP5887724.1 class I SAM-dependent methyltransferase [Streptomyces sp. LBUM 1487]MBP5903729.1 class I SAM-dependent methyltransferase [Streptomyces sp. LBUM 1488]